ncbi:MAG: phage tail assembly chaperone [Hyphomicrobiaceae bacterium]
MSPAPHSSRSAELAWAEVMAFGLGTLRLSPSQFWAMTPLELAAAMRGLGVGPAHRAVPARSDLDRLLAAFPDGERS